MWRKLVYKNKMVILEANNKMRKIEGKEWYFLVAQHTDASQDPHMCPLGFLFDEAAFSVSGHIYMFLFRAQFNKE